MGKNVLKPNVLSHGTIAADALAQVLVCRIVGKPSEFVLNRLGEVRVLDDRVLRHFAREFRIEVGNVQYRFLETNTRGRYLWVLKRLC